MRDYRLSCQGLHTPAKLMLDKHVKLVFMPALFLLHDRPENFSVFFSERQGEGGEERHVF